MVDLLLDRQGRCKRCADEVGQMSVDAPRFLYNAEQQAGIEAAIPETALSHPSLTIMLLEQDADWYLWQVEESTKLPDRRHSREKREQVLDELRRVRGMIKRDERIAAWLENKDKIYDANFSPTKLLCQMFLKNRITGFGIKHEFAACVLDDLIRWHEEESIEEALKDGRARRHRNEYIGKVVGHWAETNRIAAADCEISAVDGSPMLAFIQASIDPVLAITGEAIGPERIKQIVADIKKREFLPSSVRNDAE
jgi:hypothetical protein